MVGCKSIPAKRTVQPGPFPRHERAIIREDGSCVDPPAFFDAFLSYLETQISIFSEVEFSTKLNHSLTMVLTDKRGRAKYLGGSGDALTVWISIAASTVLIFYGYDQVSSNCPICN